MSLSERPSRPNLEYLKKQARILLQQGLASDACATARFASFGISTKPKLADALHVIAREYGFDAWPALKQHIDVTVEDPLEALAAAIKTNNASLVRDVLSRHPSLQSQIDRPLPNYSFDVPAIVAAVHKEDREMIDALLEAGAGINVRSGWWAGGFGVLDSASPNLAEYLI